MTYQAGLFIRRLIGIGFLATAVAFAGCSPSSPPPSPAPSPKEPGGVREAIVDHLVERITSDRPKVSPSELRDAFHVLLRIRASMRQGDALWVLWEVDRLTPHQPYGTALVSLKAEPQVLDFGSAIDLSPPERGSNDLSAVPTVLRTSGAVYAAMAGFVDPEIDLVEFWAPFRVFGSDEPTNRAFIVPMALWGQIRWYENDEVVGAFPVTLGFARPRTQEVDRRAQMIADRFVDAILAGRWRNAATYYDSDSSPSRVLPQLAEILTANAHSRVGSPQKVQKSVFQYPLRREGVRVYLLIEMLQQDLRWKVYDYNYGIDD